MQKKLESTFYHSNDVVNLSRQLLGKILVTNLHNDGVTSGIIVETEAYNGITDRGSHAFGGRFTNRTKIMYAMGGVAYVYLCYGIHHLFNIVTGDAGSPQAILIRAVEPLHGIDIMLKRRNFQTAKTTLTSGPGSLSCALGISTPQSGTLLSGEKIWIEDRTELSPEMIQASPRVGINYAGADAQLPWRFRIKGNKWTSPAK